MVNKLYFLLARSSPNRDKRGDAGMVIILWFGLVSLMMIFIVADFMNVMNKANIVKTSMNRAVKAAAMQVDLDAVDANGDTLFGNGVFIIKDTKAREAFNNTLSHNLGIDAATYTPKDHSVLNEPCEILEFQVLNDIDNMPSTYHSATLNKDFEVEHPCVYAVIKFKVHGMLLSPEIKLGKLSSAQLLNLQDL